MAQRFDITAEEDWLAGEDKTITIDVVQGDGLTPQQMAGWGLTWELKAYPDSTTALVSKTVAASGIVIGDGSLIDDRATITIDAADTSELTPGVYYHHLRRTDSGFSVVLSRGDAFLRASGI